MATCGEVLVKLLERYGIDTIFGIPGVHTVELYRGLKETGIRHITPRHEQGAGFMADGYARTTGKVAACFIITGPGMTNIATAMAQALADSIPMLVISSVNSTHQLGRGEGRLHELPSQNRLINGVARFSHTLMHPDELPEVLARAFTQFNSQRPGPVHIEIPLDVIIAPADHLDLQPTVIPNATEPLSEEISAAADLLRGASRQLIIAGGGAIAAGAELCKLAEKLDAPVINTVNAKGLLPYSHRLAVGGSPSSALVREELEVADLVLAVGTEFGETDYDYFFAGDVKIGGKLIRIDIDAAQLTRNIAADIAICSDSRLALQALNRALTDFSPSGNEGAERASRLKEGLRQQRDPQYEAFFKAIIDTLPGAIVVGDSTQPTYYAWLNFEAEQPRSYFHSASGFGTLGYAIPAAIGAKLGRPDRPVIALIGDGGAQFTLSELASAVEAKIPVIFLIWNNQGYGEIKRFMEEAEIPTIGVDTYAPDFVGVATAMGCNAMRATDLRTLKRTLTETVNSGMPTLIELKEQDFADGHPKLK